MLHVLYWSTAVAALVGVALNVHRKRACFVVWGATNSVWAVADYVHGLPAQSALQSVYLCMSVYGFWMWGRKERTDGRTASQ